MKYIFRRLFPVFLGTLSCLLFVANAHAGPLKVTTSTQFLWGDDVFGESQAVVAQYLRFTYNPEGKNFSMAGYGRVWQDFGEARLRDDDFSGRLYYLYLDYSPIPYISMRLGRQFQSLTAGTALMDGVSLNFSKMGPLGVTVSGGRDVEYSLDSEYSREGNYFMGIGVYLENVKSTQLGVSYVRKYDESELSREELGMNFRYFFTMLSPYAEVKYDILSKAVDEAVAGMDLFLVKDLMLKAEFYQSYPTFDSTSIYSVFAVDKYREYLLRAEYSLEAPATLFAAYAKQTYEDDESADRYTVGCKYYPFKELTVTASVDYRNGYDGNLWGFEVLGDYRLKKEIALAAGVQYDVYRRPLENGDDNAQRYWIGGKWLARKNVTLTARIEDNINENFDHRPLGRVTLDWNL